jgi:hypothetical protein
MFATRMRDTAFKRSLKTVRLYLSEDGAGDWGSFRLHKNSAKPAVPAHKLARNIACEAESSIRRHYRFGPCRRKQQSTRDECGEALLDTEGDEMVRSQRGTVA